MPFGRFRKAREAMDVNLIPVMNLFVVLIPFLLMCAAFYHVGVIPSSLPSQTDGTSDIAGDPTSVTVNLVLDREGIRLSASNSVLEEAALAELAVDIPRIPQGYDLELLGKALHAIKVTYKNSDTAIVLPGPEVEYQDVVRVLDTARELTLQEGTPDERKIPLFPVVVLSSMVEES